MKDQLGSIGVGKLTGIVAVDGDPLTDSNAFGKIVFIMKDGVIYKQQAAFLNFIPQGVSTTTYYWYINCFIDNKYIYETSSNVIKSGFG